MDRTKLTALIERQARAWERADIETILADFAPDALFITPGSTSRGHEAIRKLAESSLKSVRDVQVIISRIIAEGDAGAVEWTWRETDTKSGAVHTAEDAIIFTLHDGKITYWREYFDPAQMKG